jgi:hypothetical protein
MFGNNKHKQNIVGIIYPKPIKIIPESEKVQEKEKKPKTYYQK